MWDRGIVGGWERVPSPFLLLVPIPSLRPGLRVLPRPMLILELQVRIDRLPDPVPLVLGGLADDPARHAHDKGIRRDLQSFAAYGPGRHDRPRADIGPVQEDRPHADEAVVLHSRSMDDRP